MVVIPMWAIVIAILAAFVGGIAFAVLAYIHFSMNPRPLIRFFLKHFAKNADPAVLRMSFRDVGEYYADVTTEFYEEMEP